MALNADLAARSEYLENQSRRNDLRINGIAESETWDEVESKV